MNKIYLVRIIDCIGNWKTTHISFNLDTARQCVSKLAEKYNGSTMHSIFICEYNINDFFLDLQYPYNIEFPRDNCKWIERYTQKNGIYELDEKFIEL